MDPLDMILNTQNGDVVRQVANRFQLNEGQAWSAVGALAPALTRGIGRNARNPQGLEELIGALSRGNHSQYIENPAVVTQPSAVEEGNGILGHVFGSKEVSRQVAAHAAESSGVDSGILRQMLPMLASVAMGALAKNGLGSAGGAADQPVAGQGGNLGGLLGDLLDADRDGSVIDDIVGMAGRFLR